ncbi:hypothetical protein HDU67_007206, partial [Dinochytrium kinnereticum]
MREERESISTELLVAINSGIIPCNEPLALAKPVIYAGYGNFKCSKPHGPVEYK